MKCYYRVGDGEWIKGHVTSCGAIDVYLSRVPQAGQDIYFRSPEILFVNEGLLVTGHQKVKNKEYLYELITVKVSCGWVMPKN